MISKSAICAANNADWYGAMFRAHAIDQHRDQHLWKCTKKAPAFHSNLVTLDKGNKIEINSAINEIRSSLSHPWALKDSFANLNLEMQGFKILFEASWVWRDAKDKPHFPKGDWIEIKSQVDLQKWELAWRKGQTLNSDQQFPNALLADASVTIYGKRQNQEFSAGAIANRSPDAMGISNCFSHAADPAKDYAQAVEIIHDLQPNLPLVSFERGRYLTFALQSGFKTVGDLRVWHTL